MAESNEQQIKPLYSRVVVTSDVTTEKCETDFMHCEDGAASNEEHDVSDSESPHENRFQVDRTKLRKMMTTLSDIQGKSNADLYFEKIMESTDTHIEWPRSYKNDPKCKKNPIVRISGKRPEDVTWAKGLVLASLQTNNSLLRLKMAIANADHLFIMGRNNKNINRIMDDTDTHIQFPDANQVKKGNQVTVHGKLNGLEKARVLLRLSSPILMSFEFPMNQSIPFVEDIITHFKVQIIFSTSPKPNTSLVMIRGSTRRADKLKEATRTLLNSAFGKLANKMIVSATLEVPPQHQESVKGEDNSNIISIMENTHTKILFPELSIRGSRRSQITITGTIDEVCEARAKLVNYFPIELTFDIPAENESATEIMCLGKRAGVCITISHKERESGMSVTIKGAERLIEKIYEVHSSILQLKTIFPYDKYMPKTLCLLEDAVDSALTSNNYTDRSDSASEESSNERSISNEQFPAMSTPDSGHDSEASYQDEPQQSDWILFDTNQDINETNGEKRNAQHVPYSSESAGQQSQYSWIHPNAQDINNYSNGSYQPNKTDLSTMSYSNQYYLNNTQVQPQLTYPSTSNQQANDWVIFGFKGIEAIHHMSVEQIQAHADISSHHTNRNTHSGSHVLSRKTEEIYNNQFDFDQLYSQPENVHRNESEASHSSLLANSSPLIVGTQESVAQMLICTGWGKSL